MKNLTYLFALLVVLASCSEDNPVNNGGNNTPVTQDSLVWHLDSLAISTNQYFIDTIYSADSYTLDTSIHKVKITFTGETNFDFNQGIPKIRVYLAWQPSNLFEAIGMTEINKEHTITYNSPAYNNVTFYAQILSSLNTTYKYVKLKNIKIYRTN